MEVLFVCRGNIGRSQMAKAFYNTLSEGKGIAEACGTRVNEFEGQRIGEIKTQSVKDDINAMKEIGFDISNGIRKHITPELLENADKVIIMAEQESWPDFLQNQIDDSKFIFWDVENPKDTSYEKTCEIRDIVKKKVEDLLK